MSTAKNYLIALLALTTVGAATLAWHEYRQFVAAQSTALAATERADLQKRIWDLQKSVRDLKDRLAATSAGHFAPGGDSGNGERPMLADEGPRGPWNGRGRGQQFAAMREIMSKPEVQAMLTSAEKTMIEARYASLFRNLNLSPDQTAKLADLLIERQNAMQDVFAAAREQGINPRTDPDGFRKLVADSQNAINDSIKSLLGDSDYSQFTNYEATMPQRNLVSVLQQRLTYTDAPLTTSQADQLVQILAATAPTRTSGANEAFGFGPRMDFDDRGGRMGMVFDGGAGGPGGFGAIAGRGAAPITPDAVSQAGSVLTPTQLTALQQLQQQQQNAQQLQQLLHSTWQQNNTGGNGPAPVSAPSTPPSGGTTPGH